MIVCVKVTRVRYESSAWRIARFYGESRCRPLNPFSQVTDESPKCVHETKHLGVRCGFNILMYGCAERRAERRRRVLVKNALKMCRAQTECLSFRFKNEVRGNWSSRNVRLRSTF